MVHTRRARLALTCVVAPAWSVPHFSSADIHATQKLVAMFRAGEFESAHSAAGNWSGSEAMDIVQGALSRNRAVEGHSMPPEAIQQLLDAIVHGGSWNTSAASPRRAWLPFDLPAWPHVLAGREVALMGDSTLRTLPYFMMEQYRSHGGRVEVERHRCGVHGSGCKDCLQCCHRCFDMHPADHLDFTATLSHGGEGRNASSVVRFSWKPEMKDEHDNASVARLCARPPDVLVLSKGLHAAAFRPFAHSSQRGTPIPQLIAQYEQSVASQVRRLGQMLRCLPNSTCIVWRNAQLATRTPREAPLVALINRAVRRALTADRALGTSYVLDSFAITSKANRTAAAGIKTTDGHHYPDAVSHVEWALLLVACRLHSAWSG